MATRRRSSARKPAPTSTRTSRSRSRSSGAFSTRLTPDVVRSIIGVSLLVLGAMTLIALMLPGEGALTSWWTGVFAPWFGSMRWLLPFFLLLGGWWLEWGPGTRPGSGWGITLLGLAITYVGIVSAAQVAATALGVSPATGGRIGRALAGTLSDLFTPAGAFVLLIGLAVVGVIVGFGIPLRQIMRPAVGSARWFGNTAADALRRTPLDDGDKADEVAAAAAVAATNGKTKGPGKPVMASPSPGQTGVWGEDDELAIPAAVPSKVQTSNTFAPPRGAGATASATLVAPPRPARDPDDVTDGSDSPLTKGRIEYVLPPLELLEDVATPTHSGSDEAVHARNEEIIVKKLSGFGIPARVVARNAGPVVTQYEVQPAPDIKVSRIEALADDLAMALAARSLRIEAPIP
ncbi:MAG TPA: DNA translocase FtsK 4TM domain-containing protein, partial [Actinomycetota bacterium]|nr:DNA translocase FtsK 4TM domain-containing protein [Actinomycetota bacterium]